MILYVEQQTLAPTSELPTPLKKLTVKKDILISIETLLYPQYSTPCILKPEIINFNRSLYLNKTLYGILNTSFLNIFPM